MISYELQMQPWNYLFSTGCSRCCSCHQDHMAHSCSEIGGRIILGFLVHTHAIVWICRYGWSCAFACARDFLRLAESQHPTFLVALSKKKRHEHCLIAFVRFIWGDSYLSDSPLWDNSEEEAGWVLASGKRSSFLLLSRSLQLLSFCFSGLWLMLYSKLSLVKLIFFQRLQNRIHKGKSYETVKIDHNLEEIQMYSLLLSSLQRNTLIWYEFLRRNFKLT